MPPSVFAIFAAAIDGSVVSTLTVNDAETVEPPLPTTYSECDPFDVPDGTVAEMEAVPAAPIVAGVAVPERTWPVEGSSSRNVRVSPVTKLETDPLSDPGREEKVVGGESETLGDATVTALLRALSTPRH